VPPGTKTSVGVSTITPGLGDKVQRTEIYKAQRFSDHAPLIMDYDWVHGG
jgi:exonuclease III